MGRSLTRTGAHARYRQPLASPSSPRVVDLPRELVPLLRRHQVDQNRARLAAGPAWQDNDLVFANEIGMPLDRALLTRMDFKPLLAAAKLPLETRLYDLRHTVATLLIDAGIDARTVADRLGHSNVSVTLGMYTHPTTPMQTRATERLAGAVFAEAKKRREKSVRGSLAHNRYTSRAEELAAASRKRRKIR